MPTTVLLLGATGFLGGTVLSTLEKDAAYDLTSLVRSGKEDKLKGRRSRVEVGDFSQLDEIESLAAAHDVVINAATSDDLDLTKAINRGLARGRKEAGKRGVLVHVSGTQLIESSGGSGNWEEVPKYDDSDLEQIKGIPDSALHRYIDLEVARADLASELVASIICPGLIYGIGTGPDKTVSDLNPDFVRKALKAGRVVYAGDGSNEWPDVHVQDVADLVLLSLKHNLSATEPAGFERFYFAENGSHTKLAHAQTIASILFSHRVLAPPSPSSSPSDSTGGPQSVPAESDAAPAWANRTTSRCVATRARKELGWAPRTEMMGEVLEEDVLATVREEGRG